MSLVDENILSEAPPILMGALRRVLKPLVRLLIAKGLTYTSITDLLKSIYVEVAESNFQLKDKPQTDSRISLLTGINRKEVRRFRNTEISSIVAPATISKGAKLVASWIGTAKYLDDNGQPKPLVRLISEGGECSFEALVGTASKDIRSRAVLDEWLRMGIVYMDEQDRVCLETNAFIPKEGLDEKTYYFGKNIHDHIAAGVHNLLEEAPPLLERNVYYDRLSPESVAILGELARKEGMQALQSINRQALTLQERDTTHPDANNRMSFGVYFYNNASSDDEAKND